MRQLTKLQKQLLINIFNNAPSNKKPYGVRDLTVGEWETLQRMNDTEVLYQNVDRFLSDLNFDFQMDKSPW